MSIASAIVLGSKIGRGANQVKRQVQGTAKKLSAGPKPKQPKPKLQPKQKPVKQTPTAPARQVSTPKPIHSNNPVKPFAAPKANKKQVQKAINKPKRAPLGVSPAGLRQKIK